MSESRESPKSPLAAVRVALVEDNQVFRETLELLFGLRSDVEVVASVENGNDAVSICREHQPDVVVMDYRLPGADALEVTAALRRECPDVAVVCLTASADLRELEALRQAGVVACLSKDEELDVIVEALHSAVRS